MTDIYILDGRTPKPVDDVIEWGKWFGSADRQVASDQIGDAHVSTVFIGLDHNFGDGPPHLFETMIFGGGHDDFQSRCSTWREAEEMHEKACALVRDNKQ